MKRENSENDDFGNEDLTKNKYEQVKSEKG